MLTRLIRIQLAVFAVISVTVIVVLGWYYVRIPTLVGVDRYTLTVNLPVTGGLYKTSNVTYRGTTIGRVTDVRPTQTGARATLSIDVRYHIPVDAAAEVHSVSAIGEQYLDLVSPIDSGPYLSNGQTITKSTVPSPIGPALDATNRALAALPTDKIPSLLDETSQAVGGLGPVLQRLVNSTQLVVSDFNTNLGDVHDIIANSAPIIDSQVASGPSIQNWSANLDTLAAQTADQDQVLRSIISQAAPTTNDTAAVLNSVRESLPQVLANVEIVVDMLKRYHAGIEQLLVVLPQGASIMQTVTAPFPGKAAVDADLSVNQPPPCLTGFASASSWRSQADTSAAPLPPNLQYCKIPKEAGTAVRGARNYPCADVPGKRAATPQECRSAEPYVPAGTNPWYGDPDQMRNCPAPAARCDQSVEPGKVIPAPSVNNGLNPLPADQLPPPPSLTSDSLTPPGQGTVACNGQQPNPCTYTPTPSPTALFNVQAGEVTGPDGVKYSATDSSRSDAGDDGWKQMLAPAPTPAG
jgi:phospholipid/cholesterol/gamma-HCH transport system substrate-binding protein